MIGTDHGLHRLLVGAVTRKLLALLLLVLGAVVASAVIGTAAQYVEVAIDCGRAGHWKAAEGLAPAVEAVLSDKDADVRALAEGVGRAALACSVNALSQERPR